MVEQKRQLMMQNLFGESEEDENEAIASEPDEIGSEQESNPRPSSDSEERIIDEFEPSDQTERKGDTELDSEEEVLHHGDDILDNEHMRNQTSHEVEPTGYDGEESEENEFDSGMELENHISAVTNVTDTAEAGSDGSEGHQKVDEEDDEDAEGILQRSPEEKNAREQVPDSADMIRGVFGDSDDEEEPPGPATQSMRSPMEEEVYENTIQPEDIIRDEDGHYESEEDNDVKHKEKPVGPPLSMEIPFRPPPAHTDKMNMIKVSNIFGIDSKPFDPRTFVDEDTFVTDESGGKKRIRLENNTVRWRTTKNQDGNISYESNARFVRWSDGSLQLLIGNEVLDISVQDQLHDQAHLFLRHGKGILQSQGRLLRKMRFIPSSLTSNSHRLLTALVDSRHKKVYKVKNCVTNIDPEREKEEKEKALNLSIKANEILSKKREKVNKKYTQPVERTRQLSPGFLEEALEEEEETEYDDPRRSASRHQFEEELDVEARAEKRILNAKGGRDIHGRSSTPVKTRQRPVDFSDSEKEGSGYESSGREEVEEVKSPPRKRNIAGREDRREEEEVEEEMEQGNDASEEEDDEVEEEEERSGGGGSGRRKEMESDVEEPPTKRAAHRRMAVVYDSDDDD